MAEHAQHNVQVTGRHVVISQPQGNAGLHTPEVLGRLPWIGLLLLLIGGIAFGALSFNVYTHGPLTQWDVPLSRELPAYSLQHASYMRPITEAGFFIGGWGVIIGAFLLVIYFSSWHYWEEFFMVLIGMVGESILFDVVNLYVDRPRPPTQIWHILKIPSFPSGHTEATIVFFGFLAYLLVPKARSGLLKALIILFTLFLAVLVGFSRVMTAGHYLTDVLAGFALGLLWYGFVYTFVERFFIDRKMRHGKKGQAHPT